MPVFMTEAHGPGHIAFSRDGVGHVWGMHLKQSEAIDVREHQFLAATAHVDFTFARVQGIANMLLGGSGFFVDTFTAASNDGIVWLHGYGNVFRLLCCRAKQSILSPEDGFIKIRPCRWRRRCKGSRPAFWPARGS